MVLFIILMAFDRVPLSIASYNCRGINSMKIEYVKFLLSKVSVYFFKNIGFPMINCKILVILIPDFCTLECLDLLIQTFFGVDPSGAVQFYGGLIYVLMLQWLPWIADEYVLFVWIMANTRCFSLMCICLMKETRI